MALFFPRYSNRSILRCWLFLCFLGFLCILISDNLAIGGTTYGVASGSGIPRNLPDHLVKGFGPMIMDLVEPDLTPNNTDIRSLVSQALKVERPADAKAIETGALGTIPTLCPGICELEHPDHPIRPSLKDPLSPEGTEANLRYREMLLKVEKDVNQVQFVHNSRRFGKNPLRSGSNLVIVVQVHDRFRYLQYLVDSLKKVFNIQQTLLIFSHDVYMDQINAVVDSIDFAPVLQIFYPDNHQVYSDRFPGENPRDCPRGYKFKKASKVSCRLTNFTNAKHHWWWKLNQVFDKLEVTKGFNGSVVLLEEDQMVAPDLVHVVRLLTEQRKKDCPDCLLTLRNAAGNQNYTESDSGQVGIQAYYPNCGTVLDRRIFKRIKKCHTFFCEYNDYNWDWSLLYAAQKCFTHPLDAMVIKSSRVFHIGRCGMHSHANDCGAEAEVARITAKMEENLPHLFPKSLSVSDERTKTYQKPRMGSGAWVDPRDHDLCNSYVTDQDQSSST